jgi:hypothetical protein
MASSGPPTDTSAASHSPLPLLTLSVGSANETPIAPVLYSSGIVKIFHPALTKVPFLTLRAFPTPQQSSAVGVLLGIVLDACAVIAYNKSGYLLMSAAPPQLVDASNPDALLPPGEYMFFVGKPEQR